MASDLIKQVTGGGMDEPVSAQREGVISLDDPANEAADVLTASAGPAAAAPPAPATPAPNAAAATEPPSTPPKPVPQPVARPVPSGPSHDPFKLPGVDEALEWIDTQGFADRVWMKDGALWPGDAAVIRNRLGWLTSPTILREQTEDIRTFADEIRRLQFRHVLLLGMGGSSLCAETLNLTFGSKMGFPDLLVLDSTDPAAVRNRLDSITVNRTLFVVATKSGTTAETLAFYALFRGHVEASKPPKPGMQFVAITDPGSPLEKLAADSAFRRTFLNPATIGGRYSALSFFGLVPAALIGTDIKGLLERAQAMVEACGTEIAPRDNPAIRLGAALGAFAKAGRDKVTFVLSKKVSGLGPWLEQLLAESLGKDGKGILPVDAEPLGAPAVYGTDRVFVAVLLEGDTSHDAALTQLVDAGHPVIRIGLKDPLDLGAEFFRWELATAAAGAVLGVNPFDEPDVSRAKENTAALLAGWKKSRRLPEWAADREEDGIVLMTNSGQRPASLAEGIAAHLALARPGDYLAIQAYLAPHHDTWTRLQELRTLLRDRLRIATTVGYGPRYLHSTGQFHKGGPPSGLFIQLTGEDKEDVAIPGAGYEFSTLKAAQALGDLGALREGGRRVIRLHLGGKPANALERVIHAVRYATKAP